MCHVKYEIQRVCYTYTPLQYISEKIIRFDESKA